MRYRVCTASWQASPAKTLYLVSWVLMFTSQSSNSAYGQDNRIVLLIGLDGLRHDIFEVANMTNLEILCAKGVRAKRVRPVNPPHSWPTQQTIVTGLYPESHGIVSNGFWDPKYALRFSYASRPNFLFNFWRREGVEPIWVTNEKQGGRSAVYSWAGTEAYPRPTYVAHRHFEGWSYFWGLQSRVDEVIHYFKSNVDQIISNLKSPLPPNFSALYWDHPDWCGHDFGPDSQEYIYTMERTDKEAFGYLLHELEKNDLMGKINIIIVSDHGMKQASNVSIIGLNTFLDKRSYFLSETLTFASLWPVQGKEEEILKNMSYAKPYLTAYRKQDAPKELHYGQSRRNAPILVLPKKGYLVNYTDGYYNKPGSHSFPASDSDMHTIFIGQGPAFKPNLVVDEFESVDIYPLVMQILGLEPMPNNGSDNLWKQILREEYIDNADGIIKSAVALVRPDISSGYSHAIFGQIKFLDTDNMSSSTTEIQIVLHGLQKKTKYRLAIYTYGQPHNFGCFNIGKPFKFFDIPQRDGSLQTTVIGSDNKLTETSFRQRDMTLHGPWSVIGRMVVVESVTEGTKSLSCGSIAPMRPARQKS